MNDCTAVVVDVLHPSTRQPVGLVIECCSLTDPRVRRAERLARTDALSAWATESPDPAASRSRVLAASVVEWTWAPDVTLGGLIDPDPTEANARRVLAVPFVLRQVEAALARRAETFRVATIALQEYVKDCVGADQDFVPEPETSLSYLASCFWSLSAARSSSYGGAEALSYSEIAAWSALTGEILLPEDVETLRAMDSTYLDEIRAARDREAEEERLAAETAKQPPAMTVDLFDTMFRDPPSPGRH